MALKIYQYDSTDNQFDVVSTDSSAPVRTTHDGENGETVTVKLFLKNDNAVPGSWYDNISVAPISTPTDLVSDGNVAGWEVKLLAGNTQPTEDEWKNRVSGVALTSVADLSVASPKIHYLPQIGSAGNPNLEYFPFWMRITVPAGTRNRTESGIKLRVTAQEN